jgi:hypothetical protein
MDGYAAKLWTALPGIVVSYDATQGTVTVQPAIQLQYTDPDTGATSWQNINQLIHVPVVFMGGGAFVTTYPIQPGDECLVIFADRCIDSWWAKGGIQQQFKLRLHSLSDGIAIVGPRSLARLIPNVSTTTVQLRSLDGSTYVELAPGGQANIVAPGGVKITGDLVVTGAVTSAGEGVFGAKQIRVSTHLHSGVAAGGADTGLPIP